MNASYFPVQSVFKLWRLPYILRGPPERRARSLFKAQLVLRNRKGVGSLFDRVDIDTIDAMSKCRDALVLQLVA